MLSKEEAMESFQAVHHFLTDGERRTNGGLVFCEVIEGAQRSKKEIHIELVDHKPSYNLDDDVFRSYGLRTPIWSFYKLLSWDEHTRELIIEVDQYRDIRLKRIP